MGLPTGGFFPGRLAAEVSRPYEDTKPHYMLSTGGYVMKYPDEGSAQALRALQPGVAQDELTVGPPRQRLDPDPHCAEHSCREQCFSS